MVYLPPPPRKPPPPPPPAPAPQPTPATPPPPTPPTPPERLVPPPEKEQRTPEPDANAPPEAPRTQGEEPTKDDPAGGERTGATDATPGSPAPAENSAATMESEARRIFGRPRLGTAPGVGPRASRPMEAYLPDHPERCIPKEPPPRDSSAAPQFGVVVGKIFRQDNGRPLVGGAPANARHAVRDLHRRRRRIPVPLRHVPGGQLPHAIRPGDGARATNRGCWC